MTDLPLIAIPGDDPPQIGDSPQLERLRGRAQVRLFSDRPLSADEQLRRVADADIILNSRGHVRWPAELLEQLPRLKMVTTCSIGVDAIDIDAARRQGIIVSNIPGRTAPVVAEHALALMLAAARRLAFHTAALKNGQWPQKDGVFLAGKTLGIVGAGAIGAQMARLARAIGMQVIAWTFHPSPGRAEQVGVEFVDLDHLLAASDVVSLHVKLTPDSRGLIGHRELALMKPGAILVNTARAAIVDTAALVDALQSGRLHGAAIDVYDAEPIAADNPLLACEQIVLTPHSADQTPEGMDLLNGGAVDNVLAFLDGKPQNVVT